MPWASSRSSSSAASTSVPSCVEQGGGLGRVGAGELLREAQVHAERDQLLLGAVVEVALDPPPFGVARRDYAGARGPELLGLPSDLVERGLQLRVEADVAQREAHLPREVGENVLVVRRRTARRPARAPPRSAPGALRA